MRRELPEPGRSLLRVLGMVTAFPTNPTVYPLSYQQRAIKASPANATSSFGRKQLPNELHHLFPSRRRDFNTRRDESKLSSRAVFDHKFVSPWVTEATFASARVGDVQK